MIKCGIKWNEVSKNAYITMAAATHDLMTSQNILTCSVMLSCDGIMYHDAIFQKNLPWYNIKKAELWFFCLFYVDTAGTVVLDRCLQLFTLVCSVQRCKGRVGVLPCYRQSPGGVMNVGAALRESIMACSWFTLQFITLWRTNRC